MEIGYRPNYFCGGYVMPHLSTHQVGRFLHFAANHQMVGFDQDSLYGHWSVKGPMLYLHMRLAVHPTLPVEQVRREYFSAFGPAAEQVESYFDFWETYSANRTGGSLYNPVTAHFAYPQRVFEAPRAQLAEALALAEAHDDPQYAGRVRFLQLGLEHAALVARMVGHLDMGKLPAADPRRVAEARRAARAVRDFRREHERTYFIDLSGMQGEARAFPIEALLVEGEEALDAHAQPNPLTGLLTDWQFRKDSTDRGVAERWFVRSDATDTLWDPIVVPAFWDHTHVGPYEGYGWYRTHFEIPAALRGEHLRIQFEAVDEQAWVYLNGELVGEHTVASEGLGIGHLWDRAFQVVLPVHLLKTEGENELVVRVHNAHAAGGIWRSVNLWAPRDL